MTAQNTTLSPLAWQREAERQRVMARLADARGEQVWGKRARQLAERYARYANEGLAH